MDLPDLSSIQKQNDNISDNNGNISDNQNSKLEKQQKTKEETIEKQPKEIINEEDEVIEKRKLIITIQRYILEFEKHLIGMDFLHTTDYRNFSKEELERLLKEIKFTIATRNSNRMSERMFQKTLLYLEKSLTTFTPIKCDGLSDILGNDPDVLDTFKEMMLDTPLIYVSPKYRLAYAIISSIANLHIINSSKKSIDLTKKLDSRLENINKKFDNTINNQKDSIIIEV